MPFLRDKAPLPVQPANPCKHPNAIYQQDHTHKFCPDCAAWFPDENHPDNQPKQDDDALPEV